VVRDSPVARTRSTRLDDPVRRSTSMIRSRLRWRSDPSDPGDSFI
jgi:hypothetical protein